MGKQMEMQKQQSEADQKMKSEMMALIHQGEPPVAQHPVGVPSYTPPPVAQYPVGVPSYTPPVIAKMPSYVPPGQSAAFAAPPQPQYAPSPMIRPSDALKVTVKQQGPFLH